MKMKRKQILSIRDIESFEACLTSDSNIRANKVVFSEEQREDLNSIRDRINEEKPPWQVLRLEEDLTKDEEVYTHIVKIMFNGEQSKLYVVSFGK